MKKLNNYLFIFLFSIFGATSLFGEQSKEIIMPPNPSIRLVPILTTTAIIEVYLEGDFKGIVLIDRGKLPFGKAIPGGKVEYGETVEDAVRREMLEEVNLTLTDLRQFHVYSNPKRDFRHHSVEVTHVAKAYSLPKAGDDAMNAHVISLDNIPWTQLAFDHAEILRDYVNWKSGDESIVMLQK